MSLLIFNRFHICYDFSKIDFEQVIAGWALSGPKLEKVACGQISGKIPVIDFIFFVRLKFRSTL